MAFLENKCPHCRAAPIISYLIHLNHECENCGYVFEGEQGAFTGALYLNLTLMGLSTFPFILILVASAVSETHDVSIFGTALATLVWLLLISPITLRYSKIFWAHMIYKKKEK